MNIDFIKSQDGDLTNIFKESFEWADDVRLGVAYGSYRAFREVKKEIEEFLRNDGKLRSLFDIEEFITDKELIEEFSTIPGDSECKIYFRPEKYYEEFPHKYHPKLYLFEGDNKYRVILGSSNFTLGGLGNNIESNICLTSSDDEFYEIFKNQFEELWKLKCTFNILQDSELLEEYESQKSTYHKQSTKLKKKRKSINDYVASLYELEEKTLNENFSYLLGLISAHSYWDFESKQLTIDLARGIVNRTNEYKGIYYYPELSDYSITQKKAHKKDLERISERLDELIKKKGANDELIKNKVSDLHYQLIIDFSEYSSLWDEITSYDLELKSGKTIPFVPHDVMESDNKKILIAFLSGYCDLRSRLSPSDGIYDGSYPNREFSTLRMGISFPTDAVEILEQIELLFNKIGIDKGMSVTDPEKRTRENLIRIDVTKLPYELFGTHWKRIFLRDFQYFINHDKTKYNPDQEEMFD